MIPGFLIYVMSSWRLDWMWFVAAAGTSAFVLVDGEAVLLEEIDFDAERFPGLARLVRKDRALSDIVEQHYRMRPESADTESRRTDISAQNGLLSARKPRISKLFLLPRSRCCNMN